MNGDTALTLAPMPARPLDQLVSEDLVTEILWDLGDAGAKDDDRLAGTHLAVVAVQSHYLRSTTLRAVGKTGVDLVDSSTTGSSATASTTARPCARW